jgi:microsomal epoxide hydrolase
MPAWIFEKQLQHFSKKHSVFSMDPRSQGDSTQTTEGLYAGARATDIKAVVDQLHLKPVVLVGWSLACSEIVSYLDQFGSDGIAGVVLIDGLVGCDPGSPIMPLMLQYWAEFQKNRSKNTFEFVQGMFLQPQSRKYLDNLTATSLITPTNTFMTLVYNMLLMDLRHSLPAIKTPTLICTTRNFWLDNMKEMEKLIPNSRLEIIENAGHALFVDQPEQFNRILEKFLEKECLYEQL